MSKLSIHRAHALTHKQAVKVAEQVAQDLGEKYGIETEWAGSTAHVRGKGLKGTLQVAPAQFKLDLDLGLLLAIFSDKIASGIETEFDRLLAPSSASKKKSSRNARTES